MSCVTAQRIHAERLGLNIQGACDEAASASAVALAILETMLRDPAKVLPLMDTLETAVHANHESHRRLSALLLETAHAF